MNSTGLIDFYSSYDGYNYSRVRKRIREESYSAVDQRHLSFPFHIFNSYPTPSFSLIRPLNYSVSPYTMLCYAMLCYAMLCYAMLCNALLCFALLCSEFLFSSHFLYFLISFSCLVFFSFLITSPPAFSPSFLFNIP